MSSPKVGQLKDRTLPKTAAYYCLARVRNDESLDSDNDGMDGVYELGSYHG